MQSDNVINTLNKSLTSELDDHVFDDFAARIQTYIDGQKWIKKTISLSPPVCSQYGWKCIKSDLLECVTCGAKLSIFEPKIGNYDSYKACIEKSLSNLKNNHGKHCPWPLTPSPENFVRMILMPKEEALSQFLKRVESSLRFQSSFPKIKESVLNDLGLNEQEIMSLCKLAKITPVDASQIGKSIIPLSVTGWTIMKDEESEKSLLKCNNCLRSIWCGSFAVLQSDNCQIKENESDDTNDKISSQSPENGDHKDNEEPPMKRKRVSLIIKKGEPFDPLHEHRPWCLWIHNGVEDYISVPCESRSNKIKISSNIPGWKVFLKSLLKNIFDGQSLAVNNSPSREQIRNVKNLLEKWTDV